VTGFQVEPGAALYLVANSVIATLAAIRLVGKTRRCVRRYQQARSGEVRVDFRSIEERARLAFFGGVYDFGLIALALALSAIGHAMGVIP